MPEPLSPAALAVLDQVHLLEQQPSWFQCTSHDGCKGGLRVTGGEVHAWAVDTHNPIRPVVVAVIVDGSAVLEGFTSPAEGVLLISSGWNLTRCATLELLIGSERFAAPGFTDHRFFGAASVRIEIAEFLDRQRRSWRAQRAGRLGQRRIEGTLHRLARLDSADETAWGRPAAFLQSLAQSTRTPINGTGALAVANWVISEILEDPLRRELFCLDTATANLLNEPAFNTRALRHDVSLAMLCFWRRHYQSLDLFADDGLRRIQFKFATAPFIRLKNNDTLVSPAMRQRLSAPATGHGAAGLPWSWYWVYLRQDQGQAGQLDDAAHLMAVSFREVAADALDPSRLSFNPDSWRTWWGGWACGAQPGFSRFDLALISLLEPQGAPGVLAAEHGAEHWRTRLHEIFYAPMPGLASLSLVCQTLPPIPEDDGLRCDLAIIGYTNGTGLARNMAMFVDALQPCRPLVFDARSGRCVNSDNPDANTTRARIVLLCVNAGHVPEVIGRFAALCAEAHVIGFFLWETDQPPELHRFGASLVDEIWTPSNFVADAYRRFTDVPVSTVGKGLRVPPVGSWQPAARRLQRDGAFTFLYVADFSSSIVRKNPLAAVRAFRAAFDAGNANVRLVLKLRDIDRGHWSNADGHWEELEALAEADPRIEFLVGDLSDDEYWALLGACDALVSLHRGEGFCYPVADAMMLGRPVVVTDYSGTRDFCTEATAFLVEADIVPAPPAHLRSTTPIGNWALPRHDSAVAAMRRVVTHRGEAQARAVAGKALVAQQYDFITWRDQLLTRLTPYLGSGRAAPGRLMLSSLGAAWSAASGHAD